MSVLLPDKIFTMKTKDIINYRLINQAIIYSKFKKPSEVVAHFGAIQSQDYPAARWATTYRTKKPDSQLLDTAFNEGGILRTHVMRPTWHFVAPEDIKWMIDLTGPRLIRVNEYYAKSVGVSKDMIKKGINIAVKALEGGNAFTREELKEIMLQGGFKAIDGRMVGHTLFQGEIEGFFCSGPIKNKKMSHMLLAERAPQAKGLDRDEALAELTNRYFRSHGPAQLQDYVWWSGLTTSDAKKGIEINNFKNEEVEGKKYWFIEKAKIMSAEPFAYLLPNYDEYAVAYKDRSAIFPPHSKSFYRKFEPFLGNSVIVNGTGVGGWRKDIQKGITTITVVPFRPLLKQEIALIREAVEQYGKFQNIPVTLQIYAG